MTGAQADVDADSTKFNVLELFKGLSVLFFTSKKEIGQKRLIQIGEQGRTSRQSNQNAKHYTLSATFQSCEWAVLRPNPPVTFKSRMWNAPVAVASVLWGKATCKASKTYRKSSQTSRGGGNNRRLLSSWMFCKGGQPPSLR